TATDKVGNTFAGTAISFILDNTAPTISSVTSPANGPYGVGQNLNFTVTFSENVTVTTSGGTPTIALTIGSTTPSASYVSGSGTTALVFRYTVVSGDNDSDGIASASPITLNGGTITDAAGNAATLTFTPPDTSGVLVDTTKPTTASVTTPASGSSFRGATVPATFSGSVADNTGGVGLAANSTTFTL